MNRNEFIEYIQSDKIDTKLKQLYCTDQLLPIKDRYINLLNTAYELYGDGDYHFVSSPGRSEIGGNHTDHQHGHVLAASLNIDNLAVFKYNNSNIINYKDGDKDSIVVDLDDLDINENEKYTSQSLIRGLAYKLVLEGYKVGGFDALCDSKVLIGSGISSSACFEVMIAEIFNYLFNEDKISAELKAIASQYGENHYFGKPSGLLDQMTIAVGGFVAIDFKDPNNPVIEKNDFSFDDYGYNLILINTKGDHSDLSDEYAAITSEIYSVAEKLNVKYLADSSLDNLLDNLSQIRNQVNNDRALLRAFHFYNEDRRAILQKQAIKNQDIDTLLRLMNESGRSSFEYLQNVYSSNRYKSQSLALALVCAENCLDNHGACRVHGGGFEGTIQVICPDDKLDKLNSVVSSIFGIDALLPVKIRQIGTVTVE